MLYFAYGSNMSTLRLRHRCPTAQPLGMAMLRGHRLCFHKLGVDGSAKCDAWYSGGSEDIVFGVLFDIGREDRGRLDEIEGSRYEVIQGQVERPRPRRLQRCFFYRARREYVIDGLKPFPWYRRHVLAGAIEHGFPADYVAAIAAVEAIPDPDGKRSEHEHRIAVRSAR